MYQPELANIGLVLVSVSADIKDIESKKGTGTGVFTPGISTYVTSRENITPLVYFTLLYRNIVISIFF